MDTIDRILALQEKEGISSKNLEKAANLANGSITNWKSRRYSPGVDAIIGLARYFHVTTDYLLCLSDTPTPQAVEKSITEQERLLLEAYRCADTEGQFNIIYVCMDEKKKADGKSAQQVG